MPVVGILGGYYLSYIKEDFKKIGDAFIFLGTLFIGASIALLGQLYNMDGSVLSLLVWWCILTIPVTFLFRFKSLAFITISLFYLSIFYLLDDNSFFHWWFDEEQLIRIFTLIPFSIAAVSYFVRKTVGKNFAPVLSVFALVSLKLLFLSLFVGTLDEELSLLGRSMGSLIFQHILFLGAVFLVMWLANKEYNLVLRSTTFFWLGVFLIAKYFDWVWSYQQMGISLVLFGCFLMLLVYGYIKGTKYCETLKKEGLQAENNS